MSSQGSSRQEFASLQESTGSETLHSLHESYTHKFAIDAKNNVVRHNPPPLSRKTMPRYAAAFAMLFALIFGGKAWGQTTLSVGDIQVIGATADAPDSFTFVLWRNIAAGTTIRFMDNSFTNNLNNVNGTENDMSLLFNSALAVGSVVRVENAGATLVNGNTFDGTKTGSLSGISNSGDQVFAYQGAAIGSGTDFTGRVLLHGFNFANAGWLTTGTASTNNSYLPTAISAPDANLHAGNLENYDYSGTRSGMTLTALRASVGNSENYTGSNTFTALATGGFTTTSSVELHWDANGTTAGDGGIGTWDTTTQSRFKNGAAGTTYLRWVNSSAGNEHTAVFGGNGATVTVASSGVTVSGLRFDSNGYTIRTNTVNLLGTSVEISVTNSAHNATIESVLAGSSSINKTGAGTLTLSIATTYTGGTTISGGTLRVTNTTGSATGTGAVTVASGGTLSGGTGSNTTIGFITGATTVQTGGTIRGDSGTGTNTLTLGNTSLIGGTGSTGATLATQLTTSSGNISGNSKLAVSTNTFNLDVTGGRVNIALLNDAGLTNGGSYTIQLVTGSASSYLRNGSAATGGNAYALTDINLVSGSNSWIFTPTSFSVDVNNNLVLGFTVAPVPEPATVLAIGALG